MGRCNRVNIYIPILSSKLVFNGFHCSIRPQSIIGLNISQLLSHETKNVFKDATFTMLADDSKTMEVVFHVLHQNIARKPMEMEGKGMLMYNRVTCEPSHTMWVIKPIESRRWSILDEEVAPPPFLNGIRTESSSSTIENIKSLAMRRAISHGGTSLFSSNVTAHLLNIPPAFCNICERWVVAVFFEQHSELCAEIHRAEMELVTCDDGITELRQYVQGLYDLTHSEVQALENNPDTFLAEDTASIHSQDSIFGESLPLEEDTVTPLEKKQAELEKYTSLLEIMNVALSIPTPDNSACEQDSCKSKMIQIIYWRAPQTDDENIESLILVTETSIKSKVEAVNRMQDCLEYNERTRRDFKLNVIQDAEWTEFIPQEKQEDPEVVPEKPKAQETKEPPPPCTAEKAISDIAKGTQNTKQNIFRKIKDWKKSKGKRKQKKSNRNKNSSVNVTKVLEMEVIETPMASPKFPASFVNNVNTPTRRSSLTHPQQQRVQQQSSGSSTPTSLGKSPLSPLPAPVASNRAVAPTIKDFDIIKPISKGAFGSVFLAKKRVTGDYYAIKFLKKSDMIAKNQVMNVKAERMILMTQTDSPFVTKLYYTFQSKDYLYLVMEYLNGGDCSSLTKVLGSLPLDWARNYLAEVTLGLQYLHDKHIIHR